MNKKSIIPVVALKYDGRLFETATEVEKYIADEKERVRFEKELKEQEKLKDPLNFEIKSGYFDFLILKDGINTRDSDAKYVCYKAEKFNDALAKVIKRKDVGGGALLDYECYILDKNKHRTDFIIDLHSLPQNHEARKYF